MLNSNLYINTKHVTNELSVLFHIQMLLTEGTVLTYKHMHIKLQTKQMTNLRPSVYVHHHSAGVVVEQEVEIHH
jgi:hypothetical protein